MPHFGHGVYGRLFNLGLAKLNFRRGYEWLKLFKFIARHTSTYCILVLAVQAGTTENAAILTMIKMFVTAFRAPAQAFCARFGDHTSADSAHALRFTAI